MDNINLILVLRIIIKYFETCWKIINDGKRVGVRYSRKGVNEVVNIVVINRSINDTRFVIISNISLTHSLLDHLFSFLLYYS